MENFFNYFKDRRFAPIFVIIILALTGTAFALGSSVEAIQLKNLIYALPVVSVALFVIIWREIKWVRAQRRNGYKISPLSRDERVKARSKLIKSKH